MDIAIVTGASSSLGLAISKRLIQLGFRVYGLGGDYKDCSLQNVNFKPFPCDLADPAALESACSRILEKEKEIYLLVNNAKYFGQQHFEKMSLAEIERILKINLLCPLILMRMFANSLRKLQGYIIQLGSSYAESSLGGAAGAASAGGLKWMGEQFFNEYRESGIKVCHLSPEPNRARDARMQIRPGARATASIDPEAVAQAIEQILQNPFGNIVTEMVIRPLRINEPQQEPVLKIPYPDPQPIPYTVPREVIDAEEQLEEEEWKQQQQRKRKRRSARKKETAAKDPSVASADKPVAEDKKQEPKEKEPPVEAGDNQTQPRRKSRRKPRPQKAVVGFHDKGETDAQPQKNIEKDPPGKSAPGSAEKPVKKKPHRTRRKTANKKTDKPADQAPAKKDVKNEEPIAREKSAPATVNKATKKVARKTTKKTVRKRAAKKAAGPTGNDKKTS